MSKEFKPRGLFLNQEKASCSIYESGMMAYNALRDSESFELDYLEISPEKRALSYDYDFYLFNYHHQTMAWLDVRSLKKLSGLKITLVLEVAPNDPFVLCPSDAFDAYCVLDPTIIHPDQRVYAFPRPLDVANNIPAYIEKDIPVIGSFGFATPGKGFELVIEAVNQEFDRAIVRINIPFGTYADNAFWDLHKQNYADYLTDLCKKTAKKGIEVIITRDFMSKDELINWCGQNTLNCFLYNRNQPGLSATTDQAISSGRPLAISENNTFRHIAQYIKPYPFRSLSESIAISEKEVLNIQQEWSPAHFAKKFERVIDDLKLFVRPHKKLTQADFFELQCKKPANWLQLKLNSLRFLCGHIANKLFKKNGALV